MSEFHDLLSRIEKLEARQKHLENTGRQIDPNTPIEESISVVCGTFRYKYAGLSLSRIFDHILARLTTLESFSHTHAPGVTTWTGDVKPQWHPLAHGCGKPGPIGVCGHVPTITTTGSKPDHSPDAGEMVFDDSEMPHPLALKKMAEHIRQQERERCIGVITKLRGAYVGETGVLVGLDYAIEALKEDGDA